MPHIQVNGNEVPDKMPLPPVGVPVEVEVGGAEMKTSEKSGKPMLMVQFKFPDAEFDSIFDYFVEPGSNKRTNIRLKRLCSAAKVEFGATGLDTEALLGRKLKVTLKADAYNGEETRRLADYVVG
jgi:hypothetical protein